MRLTLLDWSIIAVYATVVITIGLRAARRQNTTEGYFLAGRRLRWPFIGASLYAANISTEHLVGLAGWGATIGLAAGTFEWIAVFCLIPLIVLFLPFYLKNKIYTVPEFLERRFGSSVRLSFSAFMLLLAVLVKISVSLWAAAVVLEGLLGWDKMAVIWCVGLVTALYTLKGGLNAVVFTDAIQTAVLILAAVALTGIGLHEVGGYEALRARLNDPAMFSMIKPATDPELPWPGVFIGVWLLGTFYFSMDQVLVQRVFAAKSLNEGQLGATFCAFLKTLNPVIIVGPGLIAAALYPELRNPEAGDQAYPMLLRNLMPSGLLGLTIAGFMAALMGHLSATYNSVATLVTRDFYLKLRPDADQTQQIRVGRLAVLARVRSRRPLDATDRSVRAAVQVPAERPGLPDDPLCGHFPVCGVLETNEHAGRVGVHGNGTGPVPHVNAEQPEAFPAVHEPSIAQAMVARGADRRSGLYTGAGHGLAADGRAAARKTC